jgi:hypothetical protein
VSANAEGDLETRIQYHGVFEMQNRGRTPSAERPFPLSARLHVKEVAAGPKRGTVGGDASRLVRLHLCPGSIRAHVEWAYDRERMDP